MAVDSLVDFPKLDQTIRSGRLPVLFENAIEDWAARHWKPRDLATFLGEKIFRCKVAARHCDEIQWETNCFHLEATIPQFVSWLEDAPPLDNPFAALDKDRFSVYVDYKYMAAMFEDKPHLLKAVDWGRFGLRGRGGESSTLWLGSGGTSTPCHQDCYGFNLVAQLYGRKRWVLFPPTNNLYPTRVPFEESSIFSEVNIAKPNLKRHPEFKAATPVVVELCPGQVLYVPRHWWHYVESLEPSISINTWVEMEADDEERVREAVVRTLVSGLAAAVDSDCLPLDHFLNPNENLLPMASSLQYLDQTLRVVCQAQQDSAERDASLRQSPAPGSRSALTPVREPSEPQHKSSSLEQAGPFKSAHFRENAHSGDFPPHHMSNLERFASTFKCHPVRLKAGAPKTPCGKSKGAPKNGSCGMGGKLEREMSIDSMSEDNAGDADAKASGISDDERWRGIFEESEVRPERTMRGFPPQTFSARGGREFSSGKGPDSNENLKRRFDFQDGDHHPDCKMMKMETRNIAVREKNNAEESLDSPMNKAESPTSPRTGTHAEGQMTYEGNHSTSQPESSQCASPKRKVGRVEATGGGVLSYAAFCNPEESSKSGQRPVLVPQDTDLLASNCYCSQNTQQSGPLQRCSPVEAYVLQPTTFEDLCHLFAGESDSMDVAECSSDESVGSSEEDKEGKGGDGQPAGVSAETFVKAVLHPRVVQAIAEVLMEKANKQ